MPAYSWYPAQASEVEGLVAWYVDENGVPNYTAGPTLAVVESRFEITNQGISSGRALESRVRYVDGSFVDGSYIVQLEPQGGLVGFFPPGVVPPSVNEISKLVRERVREETMAQNIRETTAREAAAQGIESTGTTSVQ